MRATPRLCLAGGALLGVACGANYEPARSPRIAVQQNAGSPVLIRDGERYEVGLLSGGLVEAVAGDPVATGYAETYQARMTTGFVAYLVGVGCAIASASLLISADSGRGVDGELLGGALGCTLGGVIAGPIVMATAQPYLWDAVNTYNDGVDARYGAPWRALPAAAPPVSLPPSPGVPGVAPPLPPAPPRPGSPPPPGPP